MRPRLLRFARGRLRDPAQAEDAVQEAIVAALEGLGRFSQRSSPGTWVIGILKHKIADCVRKSRPDRWLDLDAVESPPDDDPRADPFAAMFHRSFLERLARGLQHLPGAGARVFVARDVLGMNTAQTAREIGITQGNCSVVLHRARARLRDHLQPFRTESA